MIARNMEYSITKERRSESHLNTLEKSKYIAIRKRFLYQNATITRRKEQVKGGKCRKKIPIDATPLSPPVINVARVHPHIEKNTTEAQSPSFLPSNKIRHWLGSGSNQQPEIFTWVSVISVIVIICIFYSLSHPFRHRASELSKRYGGQLHKSVYASSATVLYTWLITSVLVALLRRFTSYHNTIIATALFFPMFFATIGFTFFFRTLIRALYVSHYRSKLVRKKAATLVQGTEYFLRTLSDGSPHNKKSRKYKHLRSDPIVCSESNDERIPGQLRKSCSLINIPSLASQKEIIKNAKRKNKEATHSKKSSAPDDAKLQPCVSANQNDRLGQTLRTMLQFSKEENDRYRIKTFRKLVPIHRPFRKLVKTSFALSIFLCMLYARCWSRDLGVFPITNCSFVKDGQYQPSKCNFCKVVFEPFFKINREMHLHSEKNPSKYIRAIKIVKFITNRFWPSGKTKHKKTTRCKTGTGTEDIIGADESSIWMIWAFGVFLIVLNYADDEFRGKHIVHAMSERDARTGADSKYSEKEDPMDEQDFFSVGEEEGFQKEQENVRSCIVDSKVERPTGTHMDMVPWYTFLLLSTVFDLIVQLTVFVGRYDARTMQPALQISRPKTKKRKKAKKSEKAISHSDDSDDSNDMNDYYDNAAPGCVFECKNISENEDDCWFDFMADCGDGFDSSYQIARMLADPELNVIQNKSTRMLPRGNFVVLGGDLCYPGPTINNYEKRFFRVFEDAMPPPPSFTRSSISVHKPDLPIKGWRECFQSSSTKEEVECFSGRELLKSYCGPRAFVIPGNHDWHDGLGLFTRFILSRSWLGGWILPQERSYFALSLPHGWWVLGFDEGGYSLTWVERLYYICAFF